MTVMFGCTTPVSGYTRFSGAKGNTAPPPAAADDVETDTPPFVPPSDDSAGAKQDPFKDARSGIQDGANRLRDLVNTYHDRLSARLPEGFRENLAKVKATVLQVIDELEKTVKQILDSFQQAIESAKNGQQGQAPSGSTRDDGSAPPTA